MFWKTDCGFVSKSVASFAYSAKAAFIWMQYGTMSRIFVHVLSKAAWNGPVIQALMIPSALAPAKGTFKPSNSASALAVSPAFCFALMMSRKCFRSVRCFQSAAPLWNVTWALFPSSFSKSHRFAIAWVFFRLAPARSTLSISLKLPLDSKDASNKSDLPMFLSLADGKFLQPVKLHCTLRNFLSCAMGHMYLH